MAIGGCLSQLNFTSEEACHYVPIVTHFFKILAVLSVEALSETKMGILNFSAKGICNSNERSRKGARLYVGITIDKLLLIFLFID